MASKLAEAFVELTLRNAALVAGLANAQSDIRKFAGFAAKAMGITLTLKGAGDFLKDVANAGGDLHEAMNKVQVTFGGSAGTVTTFAQEMADRFGLVKTSTLDAAAVFGLLGQAAGMTEAQSASLATQFTKLAADASSFYNIPFEQALVRLRSGLVGETEPMRKFGVLLSAAAVEAKAMQMGLGSGTGKLTEQEKVLARIAIIWQGMAKVHGDIDRTIDGYTNAMRRLAGEWENFKADTGVGIAGGMALNVKTVREEGWMGLLSKSVVANLQDAPGALGKGARAVFGKESPFQADADRLMGVAGAGDKSAPELDPTQLRMQRWRALQGKVGSAQAEEKERMEAFGKYMDSPEMMRLRGRVMEEQLDNERRRAMAAKYFRDNQFTFAPTFNEKGKPTAFGAGPTGFGAFGMLGNLGAEISRQGLLAGLDREIADKRAKVNEWGGPHVTDAMSFLKSAQEKILQKPDETAKKQLDELVKIRDTLKAMGPAKEGIVLKGRAN